MEQFFYTETMTVMNADADFRSLLKPSALLRYVEQISTDHARAFALLTVAFLLGSCATPKVAYFTDLKPRVRPPALLRPLFSAPAS